MKSENPVCEVCEDQTEFFQDVRDPLGVVSFYRCTKCGYFTTIQTLWEWIKQLKT